MSECRCQSVILTEWAKTQGVHPQTAYRWFREGTLPVPAQRVGSRTILVNVGADAVPEAIGGMGMCARVPSPGPKDDASARCPRLPRRVAPPVNRGGGGRAQTPPPSPGSRQRG